MPNQYLSTKTPAGRALRIIGPMSWVGLVCAVCTILGWASGAAFGVFFVGVFFLPIFAYFGIPWIYGLITWIKRGKGNADFLWLEGWS